MSDTLNIFGIEYTGVTSLNAKIGSETNATELKFVRPVGTKTITENGNGIDVSNFASVNVNIPLNLQSKIINYTPVETQQTQTVTADSGYDGLSSINITVDAVSDSYIGSAVPIRDDNDLIASGAMVSVPAGYYSSLSSKNVTTGTEGTPLATKGTVSNNSMSITPSVTNAAGYINGGSHTGTAVTVSASELVSGTKSISANGTGIDVTNYASVDVSVSSSSPNLQTKTNITPTESSQTIEADNGYDGLSSVQINAISSTYVGSGITQRSSSDLTASGATVTVPSGYYSSQATKSVSSGSTTAPATISGTSASVSTGTNTLTLSKTISVTPSVTAGYISSGTAGNSSVSLQASVTTKGATTYNTSLSDQTIASGTYLTGTQTIRGVTVSNTLTAENVKSGVTITVGDSADTDRITSVTGSLAFITYYTGSSAPSSSLGLNGDIYLQTT